MSAGFSGVPFRQPHRAAERVLGDLAPLLTGSVPADRALRIVAAQQSGRRERKVAEALSAALREGRPLSSAFAADEAFFGSAAVAVARAGESSGALAEALSRYVAHLRRQVEMRRKLGGAMAYPLVVALVALVAFVLLLSLVVPRIAALLEALGGLEKAPWPTRCLMAMSGFVRGPWFIVTLGLLAAFGVLIFWPRVDGSLFMRFLRRLPFIGKVIEEGVASRFAAALSALLKAGVPLPEALRLAGPAGGDAEFARRLADVAGEVEKGVPMSLAVKGVRWAGIVTIAEVAALGEETGALAEQMDWVSGELESRSSSKSAALLALVEPALIVLMALVVGLVAAALFMPVLSLADRLGG
jgi:type IV pilus assembly protein PilC